MTIFKNILVFRVAEDSQIPSLEVLESVLSRMQFEPCGATQELSAGWVSPRGEQNSPMAESVGGHLILKLMVERKQVPASAVKAALEERIEQITQERGRAPGRKEKRQLKEEVYLDLLPRAFAKRSATMVWLDRRNHFLVVGTSSPRVADVAIDTLVQAVANADGTLKISPLITEVSPSAAMSQWLSEREAPAGFTVDRDLELKDADAGATVRYANHNLDIDEVVEHIRQGKAPTQLAMTWEKRCSFILTSALALKKIETLESVFKDSGTPEDFEGNVALATGELSEMLPALIEALGGAKEFEHPDQGDSAK